jgi:hypothetical protein
MNREPTTITRVDQISSFDNEKKCAQCLAGFGIFSRPIVCKECTRRYCSKCAKETQFPPKYATKVNLCDFCIQKLTEAKELEGLPPESEINARMEQMIKDKSMLPAVAKKLMTMKLKDKYIMVTQHQQMGEKKAQEERPSVYHAQLSNLYDPNLVNVLRTMKLTIQNASKQWISEFLTLGAIQTFLDILNSKQTRHESIKNEQAVYIEIMNILRAIMDHQTSLDRIYLNANLIATLVATFIEGSDALRNKTAWLLQILCWHSPESLEKVWKEFNQPILGVKIKILVTALVETRDVVFKTDLITFVNSLINAQSDLGMRTNWRHVFNCQGLGEAIRELNHFVDVQRQESSAAYSLCKQIAIQTEVYVRSKQADDVETVVNSVNLTDVGSLYSALCGLLQADGFQTYFLSVLQCLIKIPSNPDLANMVWQNLVDVVNMATDPRLDELDEKAQPNFLPIQDLRELLREFQRERSEELCSKWKASVPGARQRTSSEWYAHEMAFLEDFQKAKDELSAAKKLEETHSQVFSMAIFLLSCYYSVCVFCYHWQALEALRVELSDAQAKEAAELKKKIKKRKKECERVQSKLQAEEAKLKQSETALAAALEQVQAVERRLAGLEHELGETRAALEQSRSEAKEVVPFCVPRAFFSDP